jgi:hypoxanthine phosphoribosyltransferase
MASTTKVMTALLTLERLDEDRVVVIGAGPPKVGEESLRLREGERLTVRQLLLGLLVKSANDAAVALAEAVDGSETAFVRRMNRKAAALRLTATHYVTPYGLDRPGHQTSARDLARLWEVAMRRADFRSLVATRAARIPGGPLSLRRFVTTNQLLGSYRWTVGGKTGFTNRAGRCLVASASRGGRRLVAVAMGTPNAFADVRALFEYGFSKYVRARLAQRGQPVSAAPAARPSSQTGADADALVRLDQLDQVRLALAPGAATPPGSRPAGGASPGPASPRCRGAGPPAPTSGGGRPIDRRARRGRPSTAAGTDPAAATLTAGAVVRSARSHRAPSPHDRPDPAPRPPCLACRPNLTATPDLTAASSGGDPAPGPTPSSRLVRRCGCVIDRETLQGRVAELGAELRADYEGVEPDLVSVLRGGVVFLADLVRAAAMPCRVDFMAISRFDASEDTGVVRIEKDLDLDLSGAHVLVVEDIVDTGLTLTYLLRVLAARGPASLRVCALLDKRARRIVDVPLSYVGFEVPDVFLVGYGLDLDERERGRGELLAVDDLEAVRADPGPARPRGQADAAGSLPAGEDRQAATFARYVASAQGV